MNKAQSKLILTATVLGAILGLGLGVVVAETKKEHLRLAETYGENNVNIQPGFREWIAVSIAAITLIRQFSDMLTPKA
ncbi:MAG: hypothetical protein DSY55_02835 [Clostridia bacterium]|nr:MAG: hypothetical protein DSY55_02835 [Clostridia bacterium]